MGSAACAPLSPSGWFSSSPTQTTVSSSGVKPTNHASRRSLVVPVLPAASRAKPDARTAAHPARDVVRSYCGVPIFEAEGALIGTLCHYDLVPREAEQLDLELLLQVSSAIARSGLVPPYPELAA